MRTLKKKEQKVKCVHYWLIESPDGPISKGECIHCGEERRFINAFVVALKREGLLRHESKQAV